ncbi:hypothetical protein [Pelagibaculum spongiae]|uniref:Peptidase C58 YopT-type domain-containing protein n=1 Tax=Pelagibaculum spongiae TaxID=2080658 RepID=A0A2V1H1S5_9GAMM|nr:hypothetical protein [Pelagibaculum spongiae]PVZ69640.1 hypothetical protein DC094_10060 [Pelagibaculum spongiae]
MPTPALSPSNHYLPRNHSAFSDLAKKYNGHVYEHHQIDHIDRLTYMPATIIRTNEDSIIKSDNSALNGACFGLTMVVINTFFDYQSLIDQVQSLEGIGKIRGYQFMQIRMRNTAHLVKLICPQYRVSSRGFIRKESFYQHASYMEKHDNCCYFFQMGCTGNTGHAICVYKLLDKISVYDPNLGFTFFLKSTMENVCYFLDEIHKILPKYGPPGSYERSLLKMQLPSSIV